MSFATEDHVRLLAKFGELITIWNDLEYQWRSSLPRFDPSGESVVAMIALEHLPSMQLGWAARTIVTTLLRGPAKELLLEALTQLDLLREYRNYYVHGFQGVGSREVTGEPIGYFRTTTARGELLQHDRWIDEAELDEMMARLRGLRTVFAEVLFVVTGAINPLTQAPYELPILPVRAPRLPKPKRVILSSLGFPEQDLQ